MERGLLQPGSDELRHAWAQIRPLLGLALAFSCAVNLLMLTGPIFMLQIYDRVLGSGSVETLSVLVLLVVFLFAAMAIIDMSRHRLLSRAALRFQSTLEGRMFRAGLSGAAGPAGNDAITPLDSIHRLLGGPAFSAIFDLLWTPLFVLILFLFDPLLGMIAVIGGAILVGAALLNQSSSSAPLQSADQARRSARQIAGRFQISGDLVTALGLAPNSLARWQEARGRAADHALCASDRIQAFGAFTRSVRLLLQSIILAAGAYLVIREELSAGAMIASSILLGRALSPVEQLAGHWPHVQAGRDGWRSAARLLAAAPPPAQVMSLPRPRALLELTAASICAPGMSQPLLRDISLTVGPGKVLGLIGAAGSGKSSLARAICGAWPLANGTIRLGGAALDQYRPDQLAQYIGYLPQNAALYPGTVAENIARLAADPDPALVIEAARAAGAHRAILDLPQGYDTVVGDNAAGLSGGQMQLVALARAFYGQPALVVLDEPDTHLDAEGGLALMEAIRGARARSLAVVIIAHRRAVLQECDQLIHIAGGRICAAGPRGAVLDALGGRRSAPSFAGAGA
ncbi:MAG: type I secretion system permease/ATPase [Paracoccus sp. (in: a-proteobacteria)]|nr:type I secretion system permease/ATPase [Paracoccus sp. (in: a-proteobacteria)]